MENKEGLKLLRLQRGYTGVGFKPILNQLANLDTWNCNLQIPQ